VFFKLGVFGKQLYSLFNVVLPIKNESLIQATQLSALVQLVPFTVQIKCQAGGFEHFT
jgi:hypothetical protein